MNTIETMRAEWLTFRSTFPRKAWTWLAWRVPRPLAYWCAIRVGANATVGKWSDQEVPALTVADALKRWDSEHTA